MSKWLEFDKTVRSAGKKTDFYYVNNKVSGTMVGSIFWYGGFRKYVFAPNNAMVFDSGCLQDISSFLTALMADYKQQKSIQQ